MDGRCLSELGATDLRLVRSLPQIAPKVSNVCNLEEEPLRFVRARALHSDSPRPQGVTDAHPSCTNQLITAEFGVFSAQATMN